MTHKIALGCEKRVGKDVCADHIYCCLVGKGNDIAKLSFASPLYDILYYAQDLLGIPREKDRRFLQTIGTEWARKHDEAVWLKLMNRKLELNKNKHIIITDVRFENEFEFCMNKGFKMVRITRENIKTEPLKSSVIFDYFFHSSDKVLSMEKFSKLQRILAYAQLVCGFELDLNDISFYNLFKEKSLDTYKHISEVDLVNKNVKWDVVISNNSTLEELWEKIELFLSKGIKN